MEKSHSIVTKCKELQPNDGGGAHVAGKEHVVGWVVINEERGDRESEQSASWPQETGRTRNYRH